MLDAGIEIVIENVPGGEYFTERPFAEGSILASQTQGAEATRPSGTSPSSPGWAARGRGATSSSFRTGSGNNPYGFANAEFDAKADVVRHHRRRGRGSDLLQRGRTTFMTTLENGDDGLVVLPLTQKPSFYGYSNSALAAGAVSPDANNAGPLVNVVDFDLAP